MKRIAALLLLTPLLGGCLTSSPAPNPLTQRAVYELRAGYDAAFLAPAANYRRLGLCAAGQTATLTNPCADRAVVRKLQIADQQAHAALDRLQAFAQAHPTLDDSAYIAAARDAIAQATSLLALTH